jgi:hypothetical protein
LTRQPFPTRTKPLTKEEWSIAARVFEATRQYLPFLVKANAGGVVGAGFVAGKMKALSSWIRKKEGLNRRSPGVLATLPRLLITNQNKGMKHEYTKYSAI